jgi:LysM repeat protein
LESMNRRQLAFVVLLNSVVSLVVALVVVWAFDRRRPDLEELAALNPAYTQPVMAAAPATAQMPGSLAVVTATPTSATGAPPAENAQPEVEAPAAAPEAPKAEEVYVIQSGDTLAAIATRYNITIDEIVRANNMANPDFVFVGQRLVIPVRNGTAPRAGQGAEPAVQGVQVNGIENPGNLAQEVVLVANESNLPFSLQGWRLERENGPSYTFGSVPLFPGGSVRVHSAGGADTSVDLYWNQGSAVWQSGTVAKIINAQGQTVGTYTVP